jgi:DNA-binding NtrC family response regulator
LIHLCIIDDIVHAIDGERLAPHIERMIDLQQAIQSLRRGMPMATIIRDVSEMLEQHFIQRVLILTQGNKAEAARRLCIDYKTLHRKLQKYAIEYQPEGILHPR